MKLQQRRVVIGAMIAIASACSIPAFADHHHDHNKFDQNAAWEQQRDYYSHNWKHVKTEHRKALDAEMRQEWLAYHHNQWNGQYNWNNYNIQNFSTICTLRILDC